MHPYTVFNTLVKFMLRDLHKFPVNERYLTITQTAKRYGVAELTARKAFTHLKDEGYLVQVPNSCYRVAKHPE